MSEVNYERVSIEGATELVERIFRSLGLSHEDARLTADVFIDSELRGEVSHGLRMLGLHFERLKAGGIHPTAQLVQVSDAGATALFDAQNGVGQVAAAKAMDVCIRKAKEFGIAIVGVRNANSFTSTKYYTTMAAAQGKIGMAYTSVKPRVSPIGAKDGRIGNNPYSIAAPGGAGDDFLLDMACSIAGEKIAQAREEGRKIPLDWAIGPDGQPTDDPSVAMEKGFFQPFGGHKAFGIAVSHEILTNVLCGGDLFNGTGGFRPFTVPYNCSQLFIAINIASFLPVDDFKSKVGQVLQRVRGDEQRGRVFTPGEQSSQRKQDAEQAAYIDVPQSVMADLNRYAKELGA